VQLDPKRAGGSFSPADDIVAGGTCMVGFPNVTARIPRVVHHRDMQELMPCCRCMATGRESHLHCPPLLRPGEMAMYVSHPSTRK
jgi:hypothetical protein